LDAYYNAGGNFIDVANLYHDGESEEWVGEWMEARGNRDQIVLATKYTGFNDGARKDINSMGNHLKSMHLGIRDSLKRLRTDYIDIFYVHFWWVCFQLRWRLREYTTSVEEVMRGLHKLAMKGEIMYPAISDTPAWVSTS
jgi:aryl-alcohol dehydrogenase-like predicted oxidoreductase